MLLRRLKIHRFRDIVPGCELVFHAGTNVVLGKNGTGKTTLLNLVSTVLRFDFRSIRGEELDIDFEMDLRPGEEECILHASIQLMRQSTGQHEPVVIPRAVLRLTAGADHIEARLEGRSYRIEYQGRVYEPSNAPPLDVTLLVALMSGAHELGWTASAEEWNQWSLSTMQRAFRAYRFDEGLDIYAAMTGVHNANAPWGSAGSRALVILNNSADMGSAESTRADRQEEGAAERITLHREDLALALCFVPVELWKEARVSARSHPTATSILSLRDIELPFLRRAVELMGFEAGLMILKLKERGQEGSREHLIFGDFEFLLSRHGGRRQCSHEQLGHGQKRLLSLLYYLAANPGHVVADELTNGMQHEWIAAVIEALAGRQAFLTSPSPLGLAYLPLPAPDDVRRSVIRCELSEAGQMMWRNLGDDEAALLHAAHAAGTERLSEHLIHTGLW